MGGSGTGAARWGQPVAGARRGASVAAFAALVAATQVTSDSPAIRADSCLTL
ncbi:MAG: hypothetical protein ACPIOQ_64535 [Promethearchaeia archaeon]